ncbi:MAG: sigma factor-like helix-turn-helix DNA-binding protein [Aggregatilineales bacterium]|nr:response regulator transcription factor [Chloroflexota bacterium]HOA25221.1 sigma factor-like helix-turn-helix DNA-binding protein [Aggregatilineales bacterium]
MFNGDTIRIFVIERDIYARQAMVSYLSWDRRTRVVGTASSPHGMFADKNRDAALTRLDAVLLDTSLASGADALAGLIRLIMNQFNDVGVVCLAHQVDAEEALAAKAAGARAYLMREEVGLGLASAVKYALTHPFTVTGEVARCIAGGSSHIGPIAVLPERRSFPRLTDRVEQALWLCVVEGLPASIAAEEMGVSVSTVRSYIKEGYRILEAEDDTIYPMDASPAERAFLRYTMLDQPYYVKPADPVGSAA